MGARAISIILIRRLPFTVVWEAGGEKEGALLRSYWKRHWMYHSGSTRVRARWHLSPPCMQHNIYLYWGYVG